MEIKFNKNGTLKKQCIDIIKSDIKQNINNMNYYDFRIYCVNNDMVLKDSDFSTLQSFFDEQKAIAINDKLAYNRAVLAQFVDDKVDIAIDLKLIKQLLRDMKTGKLEKDDKWYATLSNDRHKLVKEMESLNKQIAILDFDSGEVDRMYKERFSADLELWK